MIISPPFLPDRAGSSEEAWLDAAMAQPASRLASTHAPEGSFPLSLKLGWHNGIHIQAPSSGGAYLPVRAVADGKVVFVHAPTVQNNDVAHPLNYNPFHADTPTAAWTSDGFVVIEHRTEIGAEGTAVTEVVYYSACMHMASIANCPRTRAPWTIGDAVYRKEELGAPGQIYGHDGQVHFEICCDEANLRRLTRRGPDWVDPLDPPPPTADGRSDSVFGSVYVYLPAGTATSVNQPTSHLRTASHAGGGNAAGGQPSPYTLRNPQWVQITCEKGVATLTSCDRLGARIGAPRSDSRYDYISSGSASAAVKAAASQSFEYDLYTVCNDRHGALDVATRAASSPSGWYELLRFGRNLGTDPLPANAAHWRKIVTPAGEVWADLNAPGTFKFSDADFPPVMGWNCFDDDPNADLRCDSLHMKTLIRDPDPQNDRRMDRVELAKRLGDAGVREKLRRTICKFPSEWDRTTVEARYGWLETEDFKTTDDDATGAQKWDRFVKHARAVTFTGLPKPFLDADWRFHPSEFVGLMRRCGWRSKRELAQLIPVNVLRKPGSHRSSAVPAWEAPNLSRAQAMLTTQATDLNLALRKFLISTPIRQACFFGNAVQETQWLSDMRESGGRDPTLHAGWYGRGFLQLTNPNGNINGGDNNYYKYFKFIGISPAVPPTVLENGWRDQIAFDTRHAAQSSAAYWIWPGKCEPTARHPNLPSVGNTNKYADDAENDLNQRNSTPTVRNGIKTWYYNQSFANCAAAVNYPASTGQSPPDMNGLIDRSTAFVNALVVLLDVSVFQDAQNQPQGIPENFVRRTLP
ncbi:hypothetical protein [Variovorax sp. IB41]|uniref:hypothetical protein n=1 Tax=Variovorax sp. IB41 TaxID=2779370 RepID=UPI0018E6E1D7|nr:hypothetical protein [Variovorax sp. IB41]MBJ2157372.1 hypothetical protein [Variovorax sp. IB41]